MSFTKEASTWSFHDANKTTIPEETLSHIIAALEKPTYQNMVEPKVYNEGLAFYGLDTPMLTMFLITGRVQDEVTYRKEYMLWIGNENDTATGYYGRSSQDTGKPDVYEVNSSWVENLLQIIEDNPKIDP